MVFGDLDLGWSDGDGFFPSFFLISSKSNPNMRYIGRCMYTVRSHNENGEQIPCRVYIDRYILLPRYLCQKAIENS